MYTVCVKCKKKFLPRCAAEDINNCQDCTERMRQLDDDELEQLEDMIREEQVIDSGGSGVFSKYEPEEDDEDL